MLICDDALQALTKLEDNSIDSLITDPPAGIAFMGKAWDKAESRDAFISGMQEIMMQCLRVMKPGAHGLVWALPRTSHWTATALEDAGFEIRDVVTHVFGSGFPKATHLMNDKKGVFCQCVSNKHSNENKNPLPNTDDHTDKDFPSCGDDLPHEDAQRLKNTPSDSPGDCHVQYDLCDEHAHSSEVDGQEPSQPQECVQEHNHSVSHDDVQASESSHSLSSARCNDRLSSLDSFLQRTSRDCTLLSTQKTSDALVQKHDVQQDCRNFDSEQSSFWKCSKCGKPRPQGWYNGGLKPASEHWILVRKPLSEKTVASNVLKHGCGGINIDASRIQFQMTDVDKKNFSPRAGMSKKDDETIYLSCSSDKRNSFAKDSLNKTLLLGRFPANFVLSHNDDCEVSPHVFPDGSTESGCTEGCAVAELDRQSGECGASGKDGKRAAKTYGQKSGSLVWIDKAGHAPFNYGDSGGGASRFFYCAKASKKDRNEGLEGMPEVECTAKLQNSAGRMENGVITNNRPSQPKNQNFHPTVKSTKLMEYLITLITPPNGVVLDPFMGSGSTGVAAKRLGFSFVGIEKEKEYFEIAEKRIG